MKNSKGKRVERSEKEAEIPNSPSEEEILEMLDQGDYSQARQYIFSARALEMLENGKFPFTSNYKCHLGFF